MARNSHPASKRAAPAGKRPGSAARGKSRPEAKRVDGAAGDTAAANAADEGRKVIVDASGATLDLSDIRSRIDAVDEKIHELISERAKLAQLVGISKSKDGLTTVDFYRPEREAQVLRMAKARNKGPLRDEEILRLFLRPLWCIEDDYGYKELHEGATRFFGIDQLFAGLTTLERDPKD